MATYIIAKLRNENYHTFTARETEPPKPYLKVKDGYFPLTAETNGTGMMVKGNGVNYRVVETYSTTITSTTEVDYNTSSTNTYTYNTSSTNTYTYNTSSTKTYSKNTSSTNTYWYTTTAKSNTAAKTGTESIPVKMTYGTRPSPIGAFETVSATHNVSITIDFEGYRTMSMGSCTGSTNKTRGVTGICFVSRAAGAVLGTYSSQATGTSYTKKHYQTTTSTWKSQSVSSTRKATTIVTFFSLTNTTSGTTYQSWTYSKKDKTSTSNYTIKATSTVNYTTNNKTSTSNYTTNNKTSTSNYTTSSQGTTTVSTSSQ